MEVTNTELLLLLGKLYVEKEVLIGKTVELTAEVGELRARNEQLQGTAE